MAITGVSSISGEQIIAAGALSARSAATALYDENGNAITSYLTAVPDGYATTGDLNDLVISISETYQPTAGMTAYQSAGDYYSASNPSGFITGVDLTPYQTIEGMTAYQSAGDYLSANALDDVSGDWNRISALTGYSANGWNIKTTGSQRQIVASPIAFTASGISPITGYLTVSSDPRRWCTITDGAIYMYNTARGNSAQFIRPDTILKWNNYASGKLDATATANFYTTANESGFISEVPAGTMNESAFGYDANDKISGYNGSAFAGQGGGGSNVTTANTGNDYNINVDGLDVYGTVTINEVPIYDLVTSYADVHQYQLYSSTSFNMHYDELAQSNMAKFTINDYEPSQIYYDGDILSFNVIFSGTVITGNWPDYGGIDFSSNIGNITIDKTNPTTPPITITGKIEYPDEVLTAEGTNEFKIIYSSDKEFQANSFDCNFYVGSGEITGTSAGPSGIYIPNINDITAMSASIGDVETLLASL